MEIAETIEQAALSALHQHIPDDLRLDLGLTLIHEPAGTISLAAQLPASAIVINRGLGFSPDAPHFNDVIREALACYEQKGIRRYFLQFLENRSLPFESFTQLGLTPARAWQKFELKRQDYKPLNRDLTIEKVADKTTRGAQIICEGFDLGCAAQPWLARLATMPNWHLFVVKIEEQVAACAAVYMQDQYAWLDFAATDPQFRGRGCQTALIQARLQFAFDHGCQRAFSCTGVDVKNDPQHSFHNLLKAGFKTTYIRNNWAPLNKH